MNYEYRDSSSVYHYCELELISRVKGLLGESLLVFVEQIGCDFSFMDHSYYVDNASCCIEIYFLDRPAIRIVERGFDEFGAMESALGCLARRLPLQLANPSMPLVC